MANTPTTFEQKWPTVILAPITVANHVVTVSDTAGLHTKAKITLSIAGLEQADFEIKRVLNDTQIQIGFIGKAIDAIENPIEYSGGMLTMSEQNRNKFGSEVVLRAVYEEEPATALRNLLVNKYGAPIDSKVGDDGLNRLAVDAAVTIQSVSVDLDALTPPNRPDPDNVLIVGSTDGTKGGIKQAVLVDNLGRIFTRDSTGKLVPVDFDDIEVTAENVNEDPVTVVYSKLGSPVATLTILYSAAGNFRKVTVA